MDTIEKPNELLALHDVSAELFGTIRRWFDVPDRVTIDLEEVDSAVTELGDPVMVAAMAMRKLQAIHLLSTPGVRTSTDVVVSIVQDLDRVLLQAPVLRLRVAAATTDWDAALVELGAGLDSEAPAAPDEVDEETLRFRSRHQKLHEAVFAVLRASQGEIRYLI
ncbi:MAG: hypothetical protein ACRDUY_07880 [Nitriliruptorales bacterium]